MTLSRRLTVTSLFLSGLLSGLFASISATASAEHAYSETCMGTVFRETPYTDISCTRRVPENSVGEAKHFKLGYDKEGRLREVRFEQNGELRAYRDRFVRAPRILIRYEGNQEIRQFYNEWGHRTLVSGDVYEAHFMLDKNGRRKELKFYGLGGKPVDNDFGIAHYRWQTRENGDVIEHRYNTAGELVRNRPGFGYQVTRFSYDADGLLTRMYNLGTGGEQLTPDEAGIAMTQISYNRHRQFTQWLNLALTGEPKRGMSDIAEIIYEPSLYSSEQVAHFNDADGAPQVTRWGAHKVVYEFDRFGNAVNRLHYGTDGKPVNSTSGIGQIRSRWTEDGAYLASETYFDKDGKATASSYSGVHEIRTIFGADSRPQSISYRDLGGRTITHKGQGYATESFTYDARGRLTGRSFTDADGNLANHGTWGVARFEYRYTDGGALRLVQSFTADGTHKKPLWNPAH